MRLAQLVAGLHAEVREMARHANHEPLFSFQEIDVKCVAALEEVGQGEFSVEIGPMKAGVTVGNRRSESFELALTLRLLEPAERDALRGRVDTRADGALEEPLGIGGE